jgi:hypothetical protein
MPTRKIYYVDCYENLYGDYLLHRERDFFSDDFIYTKCPVFNHKTNRTFVGCSPIDFKLEYNPLTNAIASDNNDILIFDQEHLSSQLPVVQLKVPSLLFFTEEENVWFEYRDHPLTALNNNFIGVGGWFNLSTWPRNSINAFTIVDVNKPVIIEKDDPLFRVSFYTQNFDDGIILEKVTDPTETSRILKEYFEYRETTASNVVKNILDSKNTTFSWKKALFSSIGINKCPFKFFH